MRAKWCSNPNVLMPGMIFYWNRGDGDVLNDAVSYHEKQLTYQELEAMITEKLGGK